MPLSHALRAEDARTPFKFILSVGGPTVLTNQCLFVKRTGRELECYIEYFNSFTLVNKNSL